MKGNRSTFLFFLMMGVVCFLNVSYVILRSARNALAVADLGGGAQSIPWFELCGTMPGAILMTMGLTWLLNRFSMRKVFFMTLGIFVVFFLSFAWVIYPLLPTWTPWDFAEPEPEPLGGLGLLVQVHHAAI